MSEPYVAPYGGLLTKTLEDEKERELKLKEQTVEVTVNNQVETLRPEALHIRGVDSLSTDDIKAFIDYYLNYNVREEQQNVEGQDEPKTKIVYEPLPIDEQISFRIQWINDTAVNITFKTHEDCYKALNKISITSSNPNISPPEAQFADSEYIANLVQEREAKPYNPIIEFRKQQDLAKRLGVSTNDVLKAQDNETGMEADETSVSFFVRQSFQSDRKVKNASAYSRYYLLHGEPERKPYRKNYRQRDSRRGPRDREEIEDLFADKLKQSESTNKWRDSNTDDDDLFADKMRNRERSPTRNRDRSRSPMRIDADES